MHQVIKRYLALIVMILCFSQSVYGAQVDMKLFYDGRAHNYKAEEIKIKVNGNELTNLELPPLSINDRTMVPARAVFEALGAELVWNEDTKEVYVTKDNNIIVLQIDNKTGNKNGTAFEMDMPPKIINDRTTIPVRAVSEALGCKVDWDSENRIVNIEEEQEVVQIPETPQQPEQNISQPQVPIQPETPSVPRPTGKEINVTNVIIPQNASSAQNFVIQASGEIEKYQNVFVDNMRIVIDIYNANMAIPNTNITVDTNAFVSGIRSAQNQVEPEKITRVVFDLRSPVNYNVSLGTDKKSVVISFSENMLKDVRFRNTNGIDYVDIEGNSAPVTNISVLNNPDRIVIDMPYTATQILGKLNFQGTKFITEAEISQYDEKTARLVLHVPENVEYSVTQNGTVSTIQVQKSTLGNVFYNSAERTVYLSKKESMNIDKIEHTDNYLIGNYKLTFPGNYTNTYGYGTYKVDDNYLTDFTVQTDTTGNTVISFNQKQILAYNVTEDNNYYYIKVLNPKEKYSKIVVLDAGHGGNDPGTNGNGLTEKGLNLDVALRIYQKFEYDGDDSIKVYITRVDDTRPANADRAAMANEIGDLFVSIHMNSADTDTRKNPIPNGTETLYKIHDNDTGEKLTSKIAATIAQQHLISALGTTNRGIVERNDLLVLNQTKVPAIIVETAFLSNPGNALMISDEATRQKAADAVYAAIVEMMTNYRIR